MFRPAVLAFTTALLSGPALADPCPDEPGGEEACVASSPWYEANRLAIHFESEDGEADWLFEVASASEYRITLDERFGDAPASGTVMVIDGRIMLTKDLEIDEGSATDSLDAAALVQQLTLKLLQHAYPGGRQEVLGVEAFRVRREHLSIAAATRRASTEFGPPWMVTGQIDNANFDWVDFELEFEVPDVEYRASFSGRWEELADPVVFRDTMAIEDWQVWPLTPQPEPAYLKPGSTARDMRIITLGDLRRILDGG
jgi:hypothetical protein